MLNNVKKKYLSKTTFLWLFCATLAGVPLLIGSIKYGKWLIGILGTLGIFAVAATLIYLSNLCLTKVERSVRDQEHRYSVKFSDEDTELLSNYGYVYLSRDWLINLPNWAFYREHILQIRYEKFDHSKGERYCCYIHTEDAETHTAWVANSKSVEKIEKWFSKKKDLQN